MKYTKFLRIFSSALILSLLMVAIPATPALAFDYDFEIDPDQGEIDDRIDITGEDWPESTDEDEEWTEVYFSEDEADTGDSIDIEVENYETVKTVSIDDDGEFDTYFTVPDEYRGYAGFGQESWSEAAGQTDGNDFGGKE